jgi:predicted RNA binding protein YcfA (HicA-like mRNA interferase family)
VASGEDAVRALRKAGFVIDRQRGSHVILRHPATGRTVSAPAHGSQDLPPGTMRTIIADAGLSVEQFRKLLG